MSPSCVAPSFEWCLFMVFFCALSGHQWGLDAVEGVVRVTWGLGSGRRRGWEMGGDGRAIDDGRFGRNKSRGSTLLIRMVRKFVTRCPKPTSKAVTTLVYYSRSRMRLTPSRDSPNQLTAFRSTLVQAKNAHLVGGNPARSIPTLQ